MSPAKPPSLTLPCAAAAAQSFTFMNHAPLIPLLIRDLRISPTEAGLLSTVAFLAGGFVAVPLGRLCDRLGPKQVTSLAMALLVVSAVGAAVAPTYGLLLLTRVVAGVSVTSVFVAGGRYVNAFWGGDRQYRAQGFHGGAIQLGIGASIFVLPLVAVHVGWRGALLASALPPLVVGLLWQWKARAGARVDTAASLASVLRRGAIWRLGFAHTSMFGTGIVLGTWIAAYVVHEFALPLAVAGAIGSVASLIGAAGRPVGGALVARRAVQSRAMIRLTLAGVIVSLGIMAWPGRPLAVSAIGMVLAGIATTLGFASIVSLAAQVAPEAPAAALGLIGLVATSGVVAGAPLVGALLSATGDFTVPLAVLALLPAASLLASWRVADGGEPP